MFDFLMNHFKIVMLVIISLQVVIITLALIFATPIGIWLCLELGLTIASGFLQFIMGLVFLWLVGSIFMTVLGVILIPIVWFFMWKEL